MKYGKWKCALCGEDVIEGQRFFYIPGKGYAHAECVYEEITGSKLFRDKIALMDANEILAYTIVRLKEATRIAESSKVKDELVSARKKIEGLAAKLEKILWDLHVEAEE